jgi:hypothetical protein
MRLIPLTLASLLTFATVAHAQELGAPPPSVLVAPPDVVRADLARDLARKGHREKIAGGVMLGVSSGLLAVSLALNLVDGLDRVGHDCGYFAATCNDNVTRGPMWIGSMATFFIGVPLLGAGIATYVVGGYHVNKARRLQLVSVGAAPLPGGATAAATFRF